RRRPSATACPAPGTPAVGTAVALHCRSLPPLCFSVCRGCVLALPRLRVAPATVAACRGLLRLSPAALHHLRQITGAPRGPTVATVVRWIIAVGYNPCKRALPFVAAASDHTQSMPPSMCLYRSLPWP
ncbi:hypothetical protein U1Q18_039349, partial [Sarracenia purpurea var. burkii]